jgi:hypothetical protein
MWADLYFENTGDAPLTVKGNITGKLYRWSGKGLLQAVDFRDADALRPYAAVLKKVG